MKLREVDRESECLGVSGCIRLCVVRVDRKRPGVRFRVFYSVVRVWLLAVSLPCHGSDGLVLRLRRC